jgi:hypothetical protein
MGLTWEWRGSEGAIIIEFPAKKTILGAEVFSRELIPALDEKFFGSFWRAPVTA